MTARQRTSTKIWIPHSTEPNCSIVGILEQLTPGQPTNGKKIALILHGSAGHKDYLFHKHLGIRLPLDLFRFDFRGCHETPGTWRQGSLEDDVVDIGVVVDYLEKTFGYQVDLVVGHSRGSIVGIHWLCTSEVGKKVSGFVNVSGRYRMRVAETALAKKWTESFLSQEYHIWTPTVARKVLSIKIYPEDVENFCKFDTSLVWDRFPQGTDVLTIHGLSDMQVPPYEAVIYARALSNRDPGTHSLHLMEDADHNFIGRQDEVVAAILEWWSAHERGDLQSGIWRGAAAGLRGRM
ncbi:ectomycorrhiza-regulated esterase [Guyanagaster necrorhizus]|uniref:Ectomycorrhiza-regulated esterase n=1 Tax=Guyanagaster necrorhizus TaxID=856835 RepID=A0A9P8AQP1_9AGAR|nr:ectomycorrhiza-regulated esterase [Guyanagaster necrorhizus MCA 3950]KAG7444200.1 ectomycorrhiza-regulated esterase [Guyanagaster necrorhizus MCA 3950]